MSALATAGPALGGEPFAQNVQNLLALQSDSYVWRILCLLALLVSVGGAVLTKLAVACFEVAQADWLTGAADDLPALLTAALDRLPGLLER